MKIKKFTISIPEPCAESWSDMTPTERGKFCAHCQKDVIDFTNKTDAEIASFVKNHKGKLCGQFMTSQLDKEFSYIEQEKYSNLKYAAALAVGLLTAEDSVAQDTKPKTEISKQKDTNQSKPNCTNSTVNDSLNNDAIEVIITAPKSSPAIRGRFITFDTIIPPNKTKLPYSLTEPVKLKKK